jgi:uncharacterized Zn-finger protein
MVPATSVSPAVNSRFPKFHNELAVPEVRIGACEFHCIGALPPFDHPHIYLNMGEQTEILCPYCATRFRFDPALAPAAADPAGCAYIDA